MSIRKFVVESYEIDGLTCSPKAVRAHQKFIEIDVLTTQIVESFAAILFHPCRLRADREDVVGSGRAPKGGQLCRNVLVWQIEAINNLECHFSAHEHFMASQLFTGHNGIIGRALWLWQMQRAGIDWSGGFLRTWYKQSL